MTGFNILDTLSELSIIVLFDGPGCEKHEGSKLGYYGLILWFSLMFYTMAGQFVVCEEFFVPVLSDLGNRLKMPEDVQGATLLAVGSSSPELFTALLGVLFLPDDNPGPGTNVGSAVFNMCCIIGLSSLAAPKPGMLQTGPLFRDSVFYFIGLIILYVHYAVISPNLMEFWESCVITSWWIIYVIVVVFWNKMEPAICERCCCCCPQREPPKIQGANPKRLLDEDGYTAPEIDIELTHGNNILPKNIKKNKTSIFHNAQKRGTTFNNKKDTLVCGIDFRDEQNDYNNFNPQNVHILHNKEFDGSIDNDFNEKLQQLLGQLNSHEKNNVKNGWIIVVQPSNNQPSNNQPSNNQPSNNQLSNIQPSNNRDAVPIKARTYSRRRTLMEHVKYEEEKNKHRMKTLGEEEHEHHSGGGAILHKILKPWHLLFSCIVPGPEGQCTQKHIMFTIFLIVVVLGMLTFLVVDCAQKIGECLHIPGDLLGISILAIGSSLPDCISSILVAKQMKLDMAVANAFGSNMFDVHLCVGFSFMLGNLTHGLKPIDLGPDDTFSYLIICAAVYQLIFWFQMWCSGLRLQKWIGAVLIILYIGFLIVFSIIYIKRAELHRGIGSAASNVRIS